jgi:hypothetical protein
VESNTTAAPTPSSALSPVETTVLIATLKAADPSGASHPIDPVYGPRPSLSSSSMICIARILGAPVTEPHGKSARNASMASYAGARRASTVDVSVWNVG